MCELPHNSHLYVSGNHRAVIIATCNIGYRPPPPHENLEYPYFYGVGYAFSSLLNCNENILRSAYIDQGSVSNYLNLFSPVEHNEGWRCKKR